LIASIISFAGLRYRGEFLLDFFLRFEAKAFLRLGVHFAEGTVVPGTTVGNL
jgi:hypothetical protein